MNRRQFTQALAALFAAPALPAISVAAAAPATALPTTAYFWADYMTRLHARCTPEMLAPFFKADMQVATQLHAQLVAENVLTPTGYAHPNLQARQPAKTIRQAPQKPSNSPQSDQTTAQKQAQTATGEQPVTTPDIRPAQAEDRTALAHLWHAGWIEAHAAHVPQTLVNMRDFDSFYIRLADMLPTTTVAGPIGAPIGFCAVKDAEIYQMYVGPEARGTGAAAALITDGCTRIKAAGHNAATLDVIPQNPRAIAFYEKMGFENQGLTDVSLDTLGDPFILPCLVMKKDLSA